jgi:hypothetical protein
MAGVAAVVAAPSGVSVETAVSGASADPGKAVRAAVGAQTADLVVRKAPTQARRARPKRGRIGHAAATVATVSTWQSAWNAATALTAASATPWPPRLAALRWKAASARPLVRRQKLTARTAAAAGVVDVAVGIGTNPVAPTTSAHKKRLATH